ncbi:MAG: GerMN domain-containing protein [Clostridia bacterium]|nr:GerMN domain-containing protein [Clostridia bacterium]
MATYLKLAALLAALVMLLTGCVPRQSGESPEDIPLPEPSAEPQSMFLGERLPSRLTNVALYYPMSDGTGFSTVTTGIRADAGETLIEATVKALLSPSGSQDAHISPGDTHLLSCEYGCGIATVNLSIDARSAQSEQDLLAQVTAIGNTLLGIEDVQGVNVLIGGQAGSFGRLPMGVQTEVVSSVTASYAQLLAEHEHLAAGGGIPVERVAVLYFPTASGWLVPELRKLSFDSDRYAEVLIEALKAGPVSERSAISIPAGIELTDPAPTLETLSTGERVLTLNFAATLANYLAFAGLDPWEFAASMALTLCSFLPETDAVHIEADGQPLASFQIGNATLSFDDGLIHRSDFSGRVGSVATLYLAAQDDTLRLVRQPVSMRNALSPRSLLAELFDYEGDGSLRFPAPDAVGASDIMGLQLSGGVVRVNLSGSFYRSCQQLTPADERALVYCIVNTLCAMEGIDAVRFYIEGLAPSTLAGSIYLKSPLMPNPGLVSEPENPSEP